MKRFKNICIKLNNFYFNFGSSNFLTILQLLFLTLKNKNLTHVFIIMKDVMKEQNSKIDIAQMNVIRMK